MWYFLVTSSNPWVTIGNLSQLLVMVTSGGTPIKSAFRDGINKILPGIFYGTAQTAFIHLPSRHTMNEPSRLSLFPKKWLGGHLLHPSWKADFIG